MTAAIVGLVGAMLGVVPQQPADALAGSDFNPAYIISDAAFYDANAMTQAQIQSFLDSNVGTCSNGSCLNVLRTTTSSHAADAMCAAYAGAASELISTIIFKVQQACGISARVILVTLQKEQSLITDKAPTSSRLDRAMGYACPDTSGCDTNYYGIYNQIYHAAWQFKRYGNPSGTSNYFTWFPVGGVSNVQYNPNTGCGTSAVRIQNAATAALYYYTPYQPNAAALANLGGTGDGCSSYGNRNFWVYYSQWFGSPTGAGNPFGNVELFQASPGTVRVGGWAIDPDTSASIQVHVYVGSVGTAFTASVNRPDVGAAYPGMGSAHGFDATVPVSGVGVQDVCVYGINTGPGANTLIGCKSMLVMGGSPVGSLDAVTTSDGTIAVSGWGLDPDTTTSIPVHIYVDDTGVAYTADESRADIGSAFPGYGDLHGFSESIAASPGSHNVCAYAINTGPGVNVLLGCKTVTVIGEAGRSPIGNFESASGGAGTVSVSGWALDPDTTTSIPVHVYVDDVGVAYTANKSRTDVGNAFPGYGDLHGFSETIAASPGSHNVCAYAINTGPGAHTLLGCKTVTVIGEQGRPPIGNFESASGSAGTVTVSGWALDPDTTASIPVHVYVDDVGVAYTANKSRTDVGRAFPGYGDLHGFSETIAASPGSHNVCAYAINTGPGGQTLLGCKIVNT